MLEWIKTFIPLLSTLVSLLLAWFVGNRISVTWAIRQKQREFQLTTRADFYRSYGEFFSIWKLWNFYKRNATKVPFPENVHWEVLQRACAAEAAVEGLLVRVASERALSAEDLANLARFRHAYQTLRVTIRRDEELAWTRDDHPEYRSFKTHAATVALLLDTAPFLADKDPADAASNLIEITANHWADEWVLKPKAKKSLPEPRGDEADS